MTVRSLPLLATSATRCYTFSLFVVIYIFTAAQQCNAANYGKHIGNLSELHHGVSGQVYAVDGRTLFIKDFTYDGEGPAAYFYAGNSKILTQNGFKVRDEHGTLNVLKRYRKKSITLYLPEGKTFNDIEWFSVYCDEYAVNFGDVKIPRNFVYLRPQKLGSLKGIHGVSSDPVIIVDAQTLLLPNFSYDGEAPDAKFWAGPGPSPSAQGIRIPDENGKEEPLRRYDHKTIVLTLPGDITFQQLGHFGIWCEAFAVDFGHVKIPQDINVPPSLKMLGVSPQSKLNCEVLDDSLAFEVRWAVAGESIVVQLVGKLDNNQYMSFGMSPDLKKSIMVGGDVVVAWVDKQTLKGYAVDYFLDSQSQCSGKRGSCPDIRIQDNSNSVRLLNAAMVNGFSIVTYQRPLKAEDKLDRPIFTNQTQAIIWAVGPLNDRNETSFHSHYLKGDRFIEFGRPPAWNCPTSEELQQRELKEQQSQRQQQQQQYQEQQQQAPPVQQQKVNEHRRSKNTDDKITITTRRPSRILPATPAPAPQDDAWEIPPIQCDEPEDGVFYAQMGPTGGKHGYPAITGHVGWGIAWYINGLLIPEIHVVRNKTYTFYTEGGDNPDIPARYHPFYITDDPVGGYQHKTPEERANITIFAGVRRQRGIVRPTGVGRLCNWVPDQNSPLANDFTSFGAYQRTLTLECDKGDPGVITWVPDNNTPDTVYYQCFTHRYLGWKIHVHDTCDPTRAEASEVREVIVPAPDQLPKTEGEASISANRNKVTSPEIFQQHQEYAPQNYEYNLRNSEAHHHPQLYHHYNHHHAQSAIHNKLISGPYFRKHYHYSLPYYHNHQLPHYKRLPHQLTHLIPAYASEKLAEHTEDQRHSPTKQLAHETYLNLIVQRDNNNNGFNYEERPTYNNQDQHYHYQSTSSAYSIQEPNNATETESPTIKSDRDLKYSKIIPDRQVMRRPSNVLINQAASPPMHSISYSIADMHAPITSSTQNIVYVKSPMVQSAQAPPPPLPLQMMIVQKRPQMPPYYHSVAPRRHPSMISTLLGSGYQPQQISGASVIPVSRQSVFYERKKAVYKGPMLSRKQTFSKPNNPHHHPTKLVKIEIKPQQPRIKIDVKNVQTEIPSSVSLKSMLLKPAKNTGFDPKSIVIEKGFKPIIRKEITNENNTNVKKSSKVIRDDSYKEIIPNRYNEYFEPVFIPSSPDDNGIKKQSKKKIQLKRMKLKLDNKDDMEMAAANKEQLDYVHLHSSILTPAPNTNKRSPKSSFLIVENQNLSEVEEVERRADETDLNISSINSEHTPVARGKRSSQKQTRSESRDYHRDHDPNMHLHHHDHNNHDNQDDHEHKESEIQSSTGEIIIANIQYIFLTIIFYYVL